MKPLIAAVLKPLWSHNLFPKVLFLLLFNQITNVYPLSVESLRIKLNRTARFCGVASQDETHFLTSHWGPHAQRCTYSMWRVGGFSCYWDRTLDRCIKGWHHRNDEKEHNETTTDISFSNKALNHGGASDSRPFGWLVCFSNSLAGRTSLVGWRTSRCHKNGQWNV